MKIMTVLGTRPEIIRLSRIISGLDEVSDHILVHTGQNFTRNLSDRFFEELNIRQPDHYLGVKGQSSAEIMAQVILKTDQIFERERPDRILILGDTYSGLCAIPASKRSIPIFHMEAGNRCYDNRVPEEGNRRIIDHTSDILLPYTEGSRQNLLRENIHPARIYVTGNPIKEVMDYHMAVLDRSDILQNINVEAKKYILVTLHRSENVDLSARLETFVAAFGKLSDSYDMPVIVSTHPRTRDKLDRLATDMPKGVRFLAPFSFFEFVKLQKHAFCVLSDSGTVQEECCILNIPSVTIRDTTERPETIDCGSNILTGCDTGRILAAVKSVTSLAGGWEIPREYLVENVSGIVIRMMIGAFEIRGIR